MTDLLFAIDPGKNACALATFVDRQFVAAESVSSWSRRVVCYPTKIVWEIPVPDAAHPYKSADLIAEAVAGARLVGQIETSCQAGCTVVDRYARNNGSCKNAKERRGWKGQIPKPLHHQRVIKRLTPDELQVMLRIKPDLLEYNAKACEVYARTLVVRGYSSSVHNLLDAVALGLTELGRM